MKKVKNDRITNDITEKVIKVMGNYSKIQKPREFMIKLLRYIAKSTKT